MVVECEHEVYIFIFFTLRVIVRSEVASPKSRWIQQFLLNFARIRGVKQDY